MRLFSRFYALCAVAACTILFFTWALTSRTYGDITPIKFGYFQTAKEFDQRLVVFGDSWSDNKTEGRQGPAWTDRLCSMFNCHQENLAQTAKFVLSGKHTGAVVDNRELDLVDRLSKTNLADFKTQLQQWLDAELPTLKGLSEEQIKFRQEHTIFVVSFGIWDIWDLVTKTDYDGAVSSLERRIKTLMEQLNQLSERWGSTELKVILTQAVDVTFLPGFTAVGDEYKNAVSLLDQWNKSLRLAAQAWQSGRIFLFDTNAFVLDRIRDWQLYAAGIEEENGLGKNRDPGWENINDPCIESGSGIKAKVMMSKDKMCENPEKYLFWDEMHLGPSAHRLMATEIYHGIDGELVNRKEPEAATPAESGETATTRHTRGFAA